MLEELIEGAREELLAACGAEFSRPDGAERLVQRLTKFFDDAARLLKLDASRGDELLSGVAEPPPDARVVGASAAMSRVRIAINRMSQRSRAPVMIVGEAGTGRRHCARALHLETYSDGEFFELEHPGQFEELDRRIETLHARTDLLGGLTVYVRNLFDSRLEIQQKVRQLTRERGLALRVVASSCEELSTHIGRQGRLGSELLQAFPNELKLPPLGEREADTSELACHLSRMASRRTGLPAVRFSEAALARVQAYAWSQHVVELAALVDRLSRDHAGKLVEDADLPELHARPSGVALRLPATGLDLAVLERELLGQALVISGNNQTRAAALLGLTRDQYRYRLAKFEISSSAHRSH
jgi:DNA-binding NtrC family response regulator